MDLNEVLVFVRVVQAGSFTAAAATLAMPKSSVSKKIADLEARVGARLLQRTTRKIGMTDAGRLYFEHASRVIADVEEADRAVGRLEAVPRGLLRVTAPLSFAGLGPVVASFLAENPDVQIELFCTDRRVNLVDEGFDVAIRAGALEDSSLVARSLGAVRLVLVASPTYLDRRGRPGSPEDLSRHDCIAFGAGSAPRTWSVHALADDERHDVRLTPRYVVNDFEMVLDAARAGIGIGLVPQTLTETDFRDVTLEHVLPEWRSGERSVSALYPTSRLLSPKVVAFVERLKREISFGVVEPRRRPA